MEKSLGKNSAKNWINGEVFLRVLGREKKNLSTLREIKKGRDFIFEWKFFKALFIS